MMSKRWRKGAIAFLAFAMAVCFAVSAIAFAETPGSVAEEPPQRHAPVFPSVSATDSHADFWEWFKRDHTDIPDGFGVTTGTDFLGFNGAPQNSAAVQLDAYRTRIYLKTTAGNAGVTRLGYFRDGSLFVDLTDFEAAFDFSQMLPEVGNFIVFGLITDANPSNAYPGMGAASGVQIRISRSGSERLDVMFGSCTDGTIDGSGAINDQTHSKTFIISSDPSKNTPLTIGVKKQDGGFTFNASIDTSDESAFPEGHDHSFNQTGNSFTYTEVQISALLAKPGVPADSAAIMMSYNGAGNVFFDYSMKDSYFKNSVNEFYTRLKTYFDARETSDAAAKKQAVQDVIDTSLRPAQRPFCASELETLANFLDGHTAYAEAAGKLDPMTAVTPELLQEALAVRTSSPRSPYFDETITQFVTEHLDASELFVARADAYLKTQAFCEAVDAVKGENDEAGIEAAQQAKAKVPSFDPFAKTDADALKALFDDAEELLQAKAGGTLVRKTVEDYRDEAAKIDSENPTAEQVKAALAKRELIDLVKANEDAELKTLLGSTDEKVYGAGAKLVTASVDALVHAVKDAGKDVGHKYADFAAALALAEPVPEFELAGTTAGEQRARYDECTEILEASVLWGTVFRAGVGPSEGFLPVDFGDVNFTGRGLEIPEFLSHSGSNGLVVETDDSGKPVAVTDKLGNAVAKDDARYGADYYNNRFHYNQAQTADGFETIFTFDRIGVFADTDYYANILNLNFMVNPDDYRIPAVSDERRSAGISLVMWLFKGQSMIQVLDPASPTGAEMFRTNINFPTTAEGIRDFQIAVRLKKNTAKNRWEISINEGEILLTNTQAPLDMFDATGKAYFSLESSISIKPAAAIEEGKIRLPIDPEQKQNSNDFVFKKIGDRKFADYEKPYYVLMEQMETAVLQGIEMTSAPAKLTYSVGEEFALTGIAVMKQYLLDDGTIYAQQAKLSDLEVAGYDKTKPGEQTVTVKLKNTDFSVSVKVTVNGGKNEDEKGCGCGIVSMGGLFGAGGLLVLAGVAILLLFRRRDQRQKQD